MKNIINTASSKQLRFMTFLSILLITILSANVTHAQESSLVDLGGKMLELVKSDTPEKILDYVNVGENLDKKAAILESFLNTKSSLENITDINKIRIFNVIKEGDNGVFFILKNGKKYFVVSSKINNLNQITEVFKLLKSKISSSLEKGEFVYKSKCYSCHGISGKGGLGPNLTDEYTKFIQSNDDLIDIITNGKKGTMMIAYKDYLTKEEIENVALYIKSLRGVKVKNGKAKEGEIKNPKLKLFSN